MTASTPGSCPSELVLDRLRLEELEPGQRAELEAHLDGCPKCEQRLKALRRESEEFDGRFSVSDLAADALERARGGDSPGFWSRFFGGQGAAGPRLSLVGASLMAVAAMVTGLHMWSEEPLPPGVRIKGDLTAAIFARRGDRQWQVSGDDWLAPGDEVRFVYTAPHPGYLYVVGADAALKMTLYDPPDMSPRQVEQGQKQEVPGSVVLDATMGHERIMVLLCKEPVPTAEVVAALERLVQQATGAGRGVASIQRLALPCSQTALLIKKRAPGVK